MSGPLPLFVSRSETEEPVAVEPAAGSCVVYSRPSPERGEDEPNEDAAAIVPFEGGVVLMVADGLGGVSGGADASTSAIGIVGKAVQAAEPDDIRDAILDGFEKADSALHRGRRAGETTLVVAEIKGGKARIYNVGDSTAMQVGGGGKIKQQTVAHSPVGYLVAAGALEQDEALHHDALHLISNTVGADEMRIDIGPSFDLAPRDTLILGSDGLFDNVLREEIVETIRKGPLTEAASALAAMALERMSNPVDGVPSKPDDLTFVLFRPAAKS